jgi:transposase
MNNPVRAIHVFVDALNSSEVGFDGVSPAATGRPLYHLSMLLKLYIYGYLNRVQSSRRLDREAGQTPTSPVLGVVKRHSRLTQGHCQLNRYGLASCTFGH